MDNQEITNIPDDTNSVQTNVSGGNQNNINNDKVNPKKPRILTKVILLLLSCFLIIVFAAITALVALRLTPTTSNDGNSNLEEMVLEQNCMQEGGEWINSVRECEGVDEIFCRINEGEFNQCASACRNDPSAEACTDQCVLVCSFN